VIDLKAIDQQKENRLFQTCRKAESFELRVNIRLYRFLDKILIRMGISKIKSDFSMK